MKRTFIALLALSSLALGAESEYVDTPLTLQTNFGVGSASGANRLSGIRFTIQDSTDRYLTTPAVAEGSLADTYTLNSIAVQFRNDSGADKIGDGLALVITDTSRQVLGISSTATAFVSYTLDDYSSKIHFVDVSFTDVTLNKGTEYYAFYVASADLTAIGVGDTLEAASVASVNLMGQGSGFTSPSSDFSFLSGVGTSLPDYTPIGAIHITAGVLIPEPATATLSLLALAGLAARRRRR